MYILIFKKIIIVAIVISCLFFLTEIEYDNFKLSPIVYPLIWISIPFILKYFLPESSLKISHVLIASLVYTAIISFYLFFSVFCAWSKDLLLYKNKKDKSTLIVCRTYDCYGTAEDCRLFNVKKLTSHIKWVTKFKEEIVDSTKWDKIPFSTDSFNP